MCSRGASQPEQHQHAMQAAGCRQHRKPEMPPLEHASGALAMQPVDNRWQKVARGSAVQTPGSTTRQPGPSSHIKQ